MTRYALLLALVLLPTAAPASVIISVPPSPPPLGLIVGDGDDVELRVDGDILIELDSGSLSATSVELIALGSVSIGAGATLLADTITICSPVVNLDGNVDTTGGMGGGGGPIGGGGVIVIGGGGVVPGGGLLSTSTTTSCDVGAPLASSLGTVTFQGPTAGNVLITATGDISLVPEPAAGALVACGLLSLGLAGLRRARSRETRAG